MTANESLLNNFNGFVKEMIDDKEDNAVIESAIDRFYETDIKENPVLVSILFEKFIVESLVPEESARKWSLDQQKLAQRSLLLRKYVHNYLEYQLDLLLILGSIINARALDDHLSDRLVAALHHNQVITELAFRHWDKCVGDVRRKTAAIANVKNLVDWINKSREEMFYEQLYDDMGD